MTIEDIMETTKHTISPDGARLYVEDGRVYRLAYDYHHPTEVTDYELLLPLPKQGFIEGTKYTLIPITWEEGLADDILTTLLSRAYSLPIAAVLPNGDPVLTIRVLKRNNRKGGLMWEKMERYTSEYWKRYGVPKPHSFKELQKAILLKKERQEEVFKIEIELSEKEAEIVQGLCKKHSSTLPI